MIKNFVFDLGNVVFKLKWNLYLRNKYKDLSEEDLNLLEDIIFDSEEWKKLDEGTIEKIEAIEIMESRLPDHLKDKAVEVMMSWKDALIINMDIINLIRELNEKDYNTYILSNAPLEIPMHIEDLEFAELFDGMVYSAVEKTLKPDEKIYKILLDRYELNPEETLFIDDKYENCEGARRLNINAYQFDYDNFDKFKMDVNNDYNLNI